MSSPAYKRRTLLINYRVQLRLIGYGILCAVISASFTIFARSLVAKQLEYFGTISPLTIAAVIGCGVTLFGLIVLFGMILTNRLAGPLFRLQRELRRLNEGEAPQPIHLREHDAYRELIAEYNAVIARLPR